MKINETNIDIISAKIANINAVIQGLVAIRDIGADTTKLQAVLDLLILDVKGDIQ